MRFCLLLLVFFLLMDDGFTQSKPVKNSLKDYEKTNRDKEKERRSFNASQRAFDSTQKIHFDSVKEAMMQKDMEQNIKKPDAPVAEKKEEEKSKENDVWLVAALFAVAVAGTVIIKKIRNTKT